MPEIDKAYEERVRRLEEAKQGIKPLHVSERVSPQDMKECRKEAAKCAGTLVLP